MKLISEITMDCLELPPAQRLKLARILMDVSEPDQDFSPDAQTAWEGEICARVEAVKSGSARYRPIAEVFEHLDQLYPAPPHPFRGHLGARHCPLRQMPGILDHPRHS